MNYLKKENGDIYDENGQMNSDLEALKKHIELLDSLNSKIIEELEAFSDQDDQIRALLNRRGRVKDLRIKAETSIKSSLVKSEVTVSKKIVSPLKKSPIKTVKKNGEQKNY